ncbi:MAG: ribosome maturation factor RimM [Pyrinomonadaceae bacterium]|nr:16S rRNA processing protein RimM [Pyrinomonadaceae bacterium]
MRDLVAVARIAKPRGLKGEVVADILTDFPERFDGLKTVIAVMPNDSRRELTLENHWFQSGRMVLKFAGINSIEDGETLRNAEICVPETDVVELDEGEYFDWQLAGCRVVTVSGEEIGKVRELMRTGATEILVVDGEKEYLIPFAEAICTEVDIENGIILIDPPEGLLEF